MGFLKDEEKQQLLDRYFDIEWFDDVSDLRCVRCHRVAISHCVSSCLHLFCKTCSKLYSDGQQQSNCPRCQDIITQPDGKNLDVEDKIHQSRISCPNKKIGCKHEAQLREIPQHLLTCGGKRQPAPLAESLENNTKKAVSNLLPVKYVLTNLPGGKGVIDELRESVQELTNKVEEKFIQMENKNDTTLNAIMERITSLEKKVEDASVGIELASKKHLEGLESTTSTMESITQTFKQYQSFLKQKMSSYVENMRVMKDSMIQEMEALQKTSEESNHLEAKTYEWTIKDVQRNIQNDNWKFKSEAFSFTGYEYEIRAKLQKEAEILNIELQIKAGDKINQLIKRSEFTSVKYIVRDLRNVKRKKDISVEADLRFDEVSGCYDWILPRRLSKKILSPPYMKNDCIKISIVFEPPSIDHDFVSNNGVILWTVYDFTIRKAGQLYCNILSPSFYTSPQGYRVKIGLKIDGSEPMKVGVDFFTGEHDDLLSFNFPHKTTVTMINQLDPSKNLVQSKQSNDVEYYEVEFERSAIGELNDFIKDDSLLLKVVIEPLQVT